MSNLSKKTQEKQVGNINKYVVIGDSVISKAFLEGGLVKYDPDMDQGEQTYELGIVHNGMKVGDSYVMGIIERFDPEQQFYTPPSKEAMMNITKVQKPSRARNQKPIHTAPQVITPVVNDTVVSTPVSVAPVSAPVSVAPVSIAPVSIAPVSTPLIATQALDEKDAIIAKLTRELEERDNLISHQKAFLDDAVMKEKEYFRQIADLSQICRQAQKSVADLTEAQLILSKFINGDESIQQ